MEEKISIPVVLAGISIEIKTAFPGIRPFFAAYMPEDPAGFAPAFTAESTEELREFYRNDYFETCEREGRKPPAKTPWNMIETIALHDRITRKLLEKDILLMHGSAIAVDGECYLFTAPSGTGKSTHTRLWREYFGDRAVMVNDDKPYLYRKNDRVMVCGTPWNGKHHLGDNIEAPLKASCVLHQAADNEIVKMTASEAMPKVFSQIYRPDKAGDLSRTLVFISDMLETVPVYALGCNMDPDAARVSYEGMQV